MAAAGSSRDYQLTSSTSPSRPLPNVFSGFLVTSQLTFWTSLTERRDLCQNLRLEGIQAFKHNFKPDRFGLAIP